MSKIKEMFLSCAFLVLAVMPSVLVARDIALTQSDNGRNLVMDIGDTLTITLGANPSTGYTWKITSQELPSLAFQSHKYIPTSPGLPGSPGLSTFTFAAIAQGPSKLCLAYARPWEKDAPPLSTFKVFVNVGSRNAKSK